MLKLKKRELKRIKAGAVSGWVIGAIAAGITFLIGVLDGIARPFKCRW